MMVERRIKALEDFVGADQNVIEGGIAEKVKYLEEQVSNMDPNRIAHISQKMKLVSNDIDELLQKHDSISPIKGSHQEMVWMFD